MPLKPMKKLLFYSLFSFFFSISFSQEIAIYNFENLNLGVITGQDGWEFSTSLATTNTGYNCPVIGTPITPQIVSMPTEGDYSSGRAIRSGDGWGNQHLILSRVNDASWSFPSFQNRQYLVLSFDVIHCHWGSMFRLAYDQNNDNNFGQNCGQPDPNEASFGLSYSTGVIRLLDANSQVVALDNYSAGSWVKAMLVVDFQANNDEGSISMFVKNIANSEAWMPAPNLQKH